MEGVWVGVELVSGVEGVVEAYVGHSLSAGLSAMISAWHIIGGTRHCGAGVWWEV